MFEPGATQTDVLEYSGIKRLIEMAIEGFSCTAFCYGQTGSGKTHTLTGPPDLVMKYTKFVQFVCFSSSFFYKRNEFDRLHQIFVFPNWLQFIGKPEPTDSRHGLVFRAFLYLFQLLQERKDTNFVLKASFLEIYNEKVSDEFFSQFTIICSIKWVLRQPIKFNNNSMFNIELHVELYEIAKKRNASNTKQCYWMSICFHSIRI